MTLMNHPIRIWCALLMFTLGTAYGIVATQVPLAQTPVTAVVACLAIILILIDLRARRKPSKPR